MESNKSIDSTESILSIHSIPSNPTLQLSAQIERHGDFRASEGVCMLGTVDTPHVELMHNLRLLNAPKAEGPEKVRGEGQDDGLSRLEDFDTL